MVDVLSGGRVGIAFGSGWHSADFVLAPSRYADRKRITLEGVTTVRALWRGESIRRQGGEGEEVQIRVLPRPVQPELPTWLTSAGSPATFQQAGEIGANVLTSLIGQTLEELATKIAVYRRARAASPLSDGSGQVTVMLHTFLASDPVLARQMAAEPLRRYLEHSLSLQESLLATPEQRIRVGVAAPAIRESLLERAVQRFLDERTLIGSPETCRTFVARLQEAGVDEVASLVDFGIPLPLVLEGLELLPDCGHPPEGHPGIA